MENISSFEFQGMRTDIGDKLLDVKYFRDVVNFNQDDTVGANKVLAPISINKIEFEREKAIDGIFGFSFLDENNKTRFQEIIVTGGNIYINFLTPKLIYSGLEQGLCDFSILNDKLFITNGKNYPLVYDGDTVYEMGAPKAILTTQNGGQDGTYYYEVTYVTAGGEERIGTRSNAIETHGKAIKLELPIGFSSVNERKIYRTDGTGKNFKLVAQIADNETLTYIDTLADSDLTNNIIEINNECPKPYFLETSNFKLIGCVADKYPTQGWATEPNVELFDSANFFDVSNRAKDNSPLTGMKRDYDKIIISSQKQIYLVDVSNEAVTVTETRSNIGCLSGYSMVRIPSDKGFDGGVIFLASDKTIRLFNGNFAQPIATSLDNLKTDNVGQAIKTLLEKTVTNNTNIYAEYFDFKYHLILDSLMYVYDIGLNSWFTYDFSLNTVLTGDFAPENFDDHYFLTGLPTRAYFSTFAVIDNEFYVGRKDGSFVEKMYSDNMYRNQPVKSKLEFPFWGVSEELKYFKEIHIYYQKNSDIDFKVTVNFDDGTVIDNFEIEDKSGGDYDSRYFSQYFFKTQDNTEDYRVLYINKYSNWVKVTIESNEKPLNFRGMRILYDKVTNKEIA